MIGNSGCVVKKWDKCDDIVIKHCNYKYPVDRLKKQVEKQKWFYYNSPLKCPKVLGTSLTGGYAFLMDYIESDNIFDANEYDLHWLKEQLIRLIDWELFNSNYKHVDKDVFYNKIKVINSIGFDLDFEFDSLYMPIGFCHGDLTLENILPQFRKDLFLIDFLDSFIDSPWIDIVKLRQDTKHKWILRGKGSVLQNNILDSLDIFFENMIPYKAYKQLQIINLARILPYSKNQYETDFLLKEIECLKQI